MRAVSSRVKSRSTASSLVIASGACALALRADPSHSQRAPAPTAAPTASAYDPPRGPGDELPEPTAPEIECRFDRVVLCRGPSPNRRSWQPAPFYMCPPEAPAPPSEINRTPHPARFSPRETRAAWRAGRQDCCYVAFVATMCR